MDDKEEFSSLISGVQAFLGMMRVDLEQIHTEPMSLKGNTLAFHDEHKYTAAAASPINNSKELLSALLIALFFVYDLAGRKGASYYNEERTSIQYDADQTLVINVLFNAESQCGIFQSELEGMVKRVFDAQAIIVHVRQYTAVKRPTHPVAILSSDYVSTDNPLSDDDSVDSRLSSPDDTEVDPSMQPILWENVNLSCFNGGCKRKKCHLMSQTFYTQHADNENNVLIMSGENRVSKGILQRLPSDG
eukprot:scaffold1401_cov180-Ochromonas_danica.AAC.7